MGTRLLLKELTKERGWGRHSVTFKTFPMFRTFLFLISTSVSGTTAK